MSVEMTSEIQTTVERKTHPPLCSSAVLATVEQRFFTTTLAACPPGLFVFEGHYGFKTEYTDDNGPEAYCEPSGEYFWGGAKTAKERANLVVMPAIIMVANDQSLPQGGAKETPE
jgi:hypothetical protein